MKYIIPLILALLLASCNAAQTGEKFVLSGETEAESMVETANCTVTLNENDATIDGNGAELRDGVLYITLGGNYRLSGDFSGSITVDVSKSEKVTLTLADLRVASTDTSAIYVACADKVNILLEGENFLSDGSAYADADGAEPSACLFSADDLEIGGNGSITVYGNCKNAIESKNDIEITGGTFKISAARNAVKGKDSVEISGGAIDILKCYDGIKSDNEKEEGRGNVTVSGGTIEMNCTDDGIQAYRSVTVTGGSITINADDDKINCDGEISIAENCIN